FKFIRSSRACLGAHHRKGICIVPTSLASHKRGSDGRNKGEEDALSKATESRIVISVDSKR
ncbi:hypothetical protein D5086_033788, partial [Populus alba]